MVERLLVEQALGREDVTARRPRVRAAARHLAASEVAGGDTGVRRRPLELPGSLVEEPCRRLEPLLSRVPAHQSILSATCLICVYSSIE